MRSRPCKLNKRMRCALEAPLNRSSGMFVFLYVKCSLSRWVQHRLKKKIKIKTNCAQRPFSWRPGLQLSLPHHLHKKIGQGQQTCSSRWLPTMRWERSFPLSPSERRVLLQTKGDNRSTRSCVHEIRDESALLRVTRWVQQRKHCSDDRHLPKYHRLDYLFCCIFRISSWTLHWETAIPWFKEHIKNG